MFNIEVEGLHTYVAAGLRVHNKAVAQPIVLDLDDDGVELVDLNLSGSFFDIDDDGYPENTGWAGADDGILAIDLDGNGVIDRADEIVFTMHAPEEASDLPALRSAFDSNDDGILDAQDTDWAAFRVWRDLNQDGVSDAGEVMTLASLGITGIVLNGIPTIQTEGTTTAFSNIVTAISSYTRADGSIGTVQDVGFTYSPFGYSLSTGEVGQGPEGSVILHGEGDLDLLRLTTSSGDLIDLTGTSFGGAFGADGTDRISAFGSRQGMLLDGGAGSDVLDGSRHGDWISGGAGADILYGGGGHDVLFIDVDDLSVDGGGGVDVAIVTGDVGVDLLLQHARIEIVQGGAGADVLTATDGANSVSLYGGAGDDVLGGSDAGDLIAGGEGADTLNGGAGDDTLFIDDMDVVSGGDGWDEAWWNGGAIVAGDVASLELEVLHASSEGDVLSVGASGEAALFGEGGDDVLTGGLGNDTLVGGVGDDLLTGADAALVTDGSDPNLAAAGGTDRAVYLGRSEWYAINDLGDGRIEIVDNRPEFWGDEGFDTLSGIDEIQFLDRTIYLNGTNNAPISDAWSWVRTFADSPLLITDDALTAQTGDFEGSGVSIGVVDNARHGSVGNTVDGDIVFTPDAGFTGRARFDYELLDPEGGSSTETAYVFVNGERPTDPTFDYQWNLRTMDVEDVWTDYTGAGVRVGIFDNGVDYTHYDLDGNYNTAIDYDYVGGDADPFPTYDDEAHGTYLAGVVGAERNGQGIVGIAYEAELAGVRGLIGIGSTWAQTTRASWIRKQADFDVTNNSWSGSAFGYNFLTDASTAQYGDDWQHVVENGRGGLGTAIVFSAGNASYAGRDVNDHNERASRYTIADGAVDEDGQDMSFTAPGSAMLVTAPGDFLPGTNAQQPYGYDGAADIASINGTSASAPNVTGVVALMLEANQELGFRDVQAILALSAKQNDPDHAGWADNGATNLNGGGMHFNHDYGFGLVDAHAAVRLAESWTLQSTAANEISIASGNLHVLDAIPDGGFVEETVTMTSDISIEYVEVMVDIVHSNIGDLVVTLISPDGTDKEQPAISRVDELDGKSERYCA